jgi:hypothetical protein
MTATCFSSLWMLGDTVNDAAGVYLVEGLDG